MGTGCDFYEGLGDQLVWAGALARDGYEDVVGQALGCSESLEDYRLRRDRLIARLKGITPGQGWPWPWKDSSSTDVAVTFALGQLWLLDDGRWVSFQDEAQTFPAKLPDMLGRPGHNLGGQPAAMYEIEDTALSLMTEAARRVLLVTLHFQAVQGGFRTTEVDSSRLFDLNRLQQELKDRDAELQGLVCRRAAQGMDPVDFGFLWWARDHLSDLAAGNAELVQVTDETPFLFGLPLPRAMDEHRPATLKLTKYEGVVGRRLQKGLGLLESCMPMFGKVRAEVALANLQELGLSLFDGKSPKDWARTPCADLGGQSLCSACRTAEGFADVRRLLQRQWLKH